jgi:hypothetical protein
MPEPATVAALLDAVSAGEHGALPTDVHATSAFWICQTTRLPGDTKTYVNHYLLLRVGRSFGACAFEQGELDPDLCAGLAGSPLDVLLGDERLGVRIAALDGYLAEAHPHRQARGAEAITLPAASAAVRARARDDAVAGLLEIESGQRVALIGVVTPLIEAIQARGGICLPCDFNLSTTHWGQPVADDMTLVLDEADAVVATGMTLSNGSFDRLLQTCREREIPLVVYAQTGSAIVPQFLGAGVTALSAEPFPFSHFSAESTTLYRYRSHAAIRKPQAGVS